MHCPNGHDTRNEVGNCFTCGEPFPDAPVIEEGAPLKDVGDTVLECPNGHTTKNEIGNCSTCGEPFADVIAIVAKDTPGPSVARVDRLLRGAGGTAVPIQLSKSSLEYLLKELDYFRQAIKGALDKLTAQENAGQEKQ